MIDPVSAFSIGSKVFGGLMGRRKRKKARRAAEAAQQRAAAEQRGLQEAQFGRVQQGESPFREAGLGALQRMANFDNSPLSADAVYNDPGYRFARDEGMRGIESTAAAKGGLFSGAALKDLTRFNTGNATQFFDNAFQRQRQDRSDRFGQLGELAGYGERSQGRLNDAGSRFADNMGNIAGGLGNFQAANEIGKGQDSINNMNTLLGAGSDLYSAWNTTKTRPPMEAIGQGVRMPDQFPIRRKDGGRVQMQSVGGRMEPKVGTRSPVRGSTGGGLSREAVLAELDRAVQVEAPQRSGIGALEANPVTDPQGIRRSRERKAGIGYKDGGAVEVAASAPVEKKGFWASLVGSKKKEPPKPEEKKPHAAVDPKSVLSAREKAAGLKSGGKVRGPGGTRGDKIPALLSDQEHVIDARTVKMIGKGSYNKGHSALDKLRRMGKHGT